MMTILLFVLGICIGSFLNVVIDRLPKNRSILGRSKCDNCEKRIPWYDLVPLLSFVFLKRKCRYCKHTLSWQYPAIELITGILFALTYLSDFQTNHTNIYPASIIAALTIISGLIVIFFTDLKYRVIPDQILILILIASFTLHRFMQTANLAPFVVSGIILFALFLGLVIITRGKGMGMGDVKYAFVMGFLLGYPASIVAFYLAFLTGAFVSLILILIRNKKFGQTIAFGPFLVLATYIAYIWGDLIWIYFISKLGLS